MVKEHCLFHKHLKNVIITEISVELNNLCFNCVALEVSFHAIWTIFSFIAALGQACSLLNSIRLWGVVDHIDDNTGR